MGTVADMFQRRRMLGWQCGGEGLPLVPQGPVHARLIDGLAHRRPAEQSEKLGQRPQVGVARILEGEEYSSFEQLRTGIRDKICNCIRGLDL